MCLSMNAAMVWFSGLCHHQLVGGRLVGLVQLRALSAAALAAAGCFAAKFAQFNSATLKWASGGVGVVPRDRYLCCLQSQINVYISRFSLYIR
jgi:hypothetical protein